MRSLLVILLFLGISCGDFPQENEILQFSTEIDNREDFNKSPDIIAPKELPDHNNMKNCYKELIVITYNCWFIICHAPCIPYDPGCHDSYCEWDNEDNNPR